MSEDLGLRLEKVAAHALRFRELLKNQSPKLEGKLKKLSLVLMFLALSPTTNAQTDLTDIGKIGIATPSPVAIIDVDGLPSPGATQVVRLRSNEPGSGDFGITHAASEGSNGETRYDNQLCLGYNIGGPGFVTSEIQWHQCFESRYKTSEGRLQSEFYITAAMGNGGVVSRPFAIDFYHDDGSTMVGAYTQQFVVGSPVDNNPWLRFLSTPTAGIVSLVRDSKIDFSGNTRDWFIVRANAGILGQSGSTGKLFTGGLGGETLNIFEGGFVNAQFPMTINVGDGGGFRIGANGQRWQVTGNYPGYSDILTGFDANIASTPSKLVTRGASSEIDVGSVKVDGLKVVGAQCAPIVDSNGGKGDNARAINEILQCLRGHGVVAPGSGGLAPSSVHFSAAGASVSETLNETRKIDIVLSRTGDTAAAAAIDYATSDGTASKRSDYQVARGRLSFEPGQTSKTITLFIVDDRFGESPETFDVDLSNPVGCTFGSPSTLRVTIDSNESVNASNPVKDASFNSDFFVRQHYLDFFNRAPDAGGLAFWKDQIDSCTDQACREIRRTNVSAAFFLSIEFQQTGYLVYKTHQASFDSGEFLKSCNFVPDTQEIGRGVVIGQLGAEAQLEANKVRFFNDFVQKARFVEPANYPTTLTAAEFVDKLNANTYDPNNPGAGSLTPGQRDALVAQLSASPASPTLRAQVLRTVAENSTFNDRQSNKAFVLMQYFGYMRRNPNDAPEAGLDFAGYNFWLGKLNEFNGNFVNAEMVKAFIVAGEYQQRFGP